MKITSIEIKNVKGISHQKFDFDFIPNKPNLLVAPNGFGKSSIAIAFDSLNQKRIDLDKNVCYRCNPQNPPELKLTIINGHEPMELIADGNQNTITDLFDIQVIRSGLRPKATRNFAGGASASLEVQSIEICKIPEKAAFEYTYTRVKEYFGENGKLLPNITNLLKDDILAEIIDTDLLEDISKNRT